MALRFSQRFTKAIRSGLGFAFLLVAFDARAGAQSLEDDIAAIQNINVIWEQAYGAGDMDVLRALYTEDSIVMPRDGTAYRGVDAIMAYFQGGAEAFDIKVRLEEEETVVHGDLAHTMGLFWIDATPKEGVEAQAFSDSGRYLILLKRSADDGWKVYRDIDQHTVDTAENAGE